MSSHYRNNKNKKSHINEIMQIPITSRSTQLQNATSNMTHEYIGLMIEMQKIMSLKFDMLEKSMTNMITENQQLKKIMNDLELKSDTMVDQLDSVCGFITSKIDFSEEQYEHPGEENTCENCQNHKPEGIPVQVPIGSIGDKNNSIQMIINQMLGKPPEKQEEIELDDDYDVNEKIYSDEPILEIPELQEFEKVPKNINDLIELGNSYASTLETFTKKKKLKLGKKDHTLPINAESLYELDGKKYSINLEKVVNLIKPLEKLNNMVGMGQVKDSVFEMILYYLQGFETRNQNMLHSVIEGPPGTGKTQLGKILAQIYNGLGIIESSRFKYVKATDLIGDHVGATKHMTQRVIDDADGGVLFIDEAYALSSNDNKDPYGKECIDTLNFNLSEKKKKLIVIVAGYPDQLDKYFFAFNPGLQRRFPFRHRIDGYSAEELRDIFVDKLKRFKWKLDNSVKMDNLTQFFKTNKETFVNFGGDIENLFKKCQYAHSNRVVGKNPMIRKRLTMDDINNGLKKFKDQKRVDDSKPKYPHLYI